MTPIPRLFRVNFALCNLFMGAISPCGPAAQYVGVPRRNGMSRGDFEADHSCAVVFGAYGRFQVMMILFTVGRPRDLHIMICICNCRVADCY